MIKNKRIFQKMIDYYHSEKIIRNTKQKISTISKKNDIQNIDKNTLVDFINYWKDFSKIKPSTQYLKCLTSISGYNSHNFVPEDIYYLEIEPVLNNRALALVYNDKNFFEKYLYQYKVLFPTTIIRGVNGSVLNENYDYVDIIEIQQILNSVLENAELILKPATETGGGNNIKIIAKKNNHFVIDGKHYSISEFMDILRYNYKQNFVLQHRIYQNEWLDKYNNTCTNVIRMYTYRSVKDEKVHILHSYFRYGNDKSRFEDYLINGGIRRGILKDGRLMNFLIGRYGEKTLITENENDNNKVPCYSDMVNIAKSIAKEYMHHRLLGFDFIIDDHGGVRLFEINNRNIGMIHHQMIGGPLFGEFTDEVVEYCKNNRKSISLHFYI